MNRRLLAALLGLALVGCRSLGDDQAAPVKRRAIPPVGLSTVPSLRESINVAPDSLASRPPQATQAPSPVPEPTPTVISKPSDSPTPEPSPPQETQVPAEPVALALPPVAAPTESKP